MGSDGAQGTRRGEGSVAVADPPSRAVAWQPQPGPQTLLLTCPVEDVFFGGARGGGKSDALLGDARKHIETYKRHANAYLFRRSYPDLEELIDRARALYEPTGGIWHVQQKEMRFPALRTQIRFRYLDRDADADHYQGRNINYLGIDEAGQFPTPTALDRLWGAMRSSHQVPVRMRLTGNPGGAGHRWLQERYIAPAPPGRIQTITLPDGSIHRRVFIPSFVADNPALMDSDPGYIGRLQLVGSPWLVRAWLEGDWNARQQGGFFDILKLHYEQPPKMRHLYLAVDTATRASEQGDRQYKDRDCTAMVVGGVDSLNRFWILDVDAQRMDSSQWVNKLFRMHQKWGFDRIWIEGGPIWAAVEPWCVQQQHLRGIHLPIRAVQPSGAGDKGIRATPLQVLLNSGGVWLPADHAPWIEPLRMQLDAFSPELARRDEIEDDQVDAVAWLAYQLMIMRRNKDPSDPTERGVGPIGKLQTNKGIIDGKAAEAILARMDEERRANRLKHDPREW
jgi:predicted phage terminase large subunit-like protein